jgi:hypothetical protein
MLIYMDEECKRRHIKCDEKRPICAGCGATNRRCSFLDLQPTRPPSPLITTAPPVTTPSSSFSASPDSSSHEAFTPATHVTDSGASRRTPDPASQLPSLFDIRHLVLLHHLETHVIRQSSLLSWIGADTAEIYSETVFEAAVSAPYLMHELLAFSALHLSTQQSDATEMAKFLQQAAELQTSALAIFNAVKHDVCNENCMALFIFSSLLGMHTLFDAVTSCTDFGGMLERTIHYLKLHRGVNAITSQSWHILRHSELRVIFDAIETGDQLYRHRVGNTENECEKLSSLVQKSSDGLGPGPYKACQEAVQALQWTFGVRSTVSEPYPVHITLAWPVRVSADFVNLLEQRQPIPLIILAHWAVLLHIDRKFWIFGNAGRHMINPLLAYLGSYWDEWLELPRSIIQQD